MLNSKTNIFTKVLSFQTVNDVLYLVDTDCVSLFLILGIKTGLCETGARSA